MYKIETVFIYHFYKHVKLMYKSENPFSFTNFINLLNFRNSKTNYI